MNKIPSKKAREKIIRRDLRENGECYRGTVAVLACEDPEGFPKMDFKISPYYNIDADERCYWDERDGAIMSLLDAEERAAKGRSTCRTCEEAQGNNPCLGGRVEPCHIYHVVPGSTKPKTERREIFDWANLRLRATSRPEGKKGKTCIGMAHTAGDYWLERAKKEARNNGAEVKIINEGVWVIFNDHEATIEVETTELTMREKRLLIFATFLMRAVTDIPDNREIRGTVAQMRLEWAQGEWKHIGPTIPKDMRKRMSKQLAEYKKAVKGMG